MGSSQIRAPAAPPRGLQAKIRRLRLSTLDRYVLGRFLLIYAANLVSFTLIFILVDAVSHIEAFTRNAEGILDFFALCFMYYAAITPLIFCQILGPVVSVSAALFAVTTFQRSNEFTPILACGRSYQRVFVPILAASLAISAGVFCIQEGWIPKTVSAIREAAESRESHNKEWHVKYHDARNGILIVFRVYDRLLQQAMGVDVIPVGRQANSQRFIRAASAEWVAPSLAGPGSSSLRGYWRLRDGLVLEYDEEREIVRPASPREWAGAPPRLYATFPERRLETDMIPGDIELRRDEAVYMTLGDLRRKAGSSPGHSGWHMKYFSRFVYPLTNFILVLLGLPVMVFFGNRNIFFGALIAVAISTGYFVVNSIFQDMGIRGAVPVRLGAGFAPILFTAVGAALYREMKS